MVWKYIDHTYNACVKNKDPNVILTSLPPPLHPTKCVDKEPNLVEKI